MGKHIRLFLLLLLCMAGSKAAEARHLQQAQVAGGASESPQGQAPATTEAIIFEVEGGDATFAPQFEEAFGDPESQAADLQYDNSYLSNPDPTPDELAKAESDLNGVSPLEPVSQAADADLDMLVAFDPQAVSSANNPFVRAERGRFMLGCEEFLFNGANSPYLMDDATNGRRWAVTATLDNLQRAGASIVRTWGFGINGSPLQTAPGMYDYSKLEGMDFVLSEMKKRGLKAVIPFVDYWTRYDSVPKYVSWSPTAKGLNDFFTDETVKKIYRDHVSFFLNRRNTITGAFYKADPTIAAWNLGNEIRCMKCPLSKMNNWINEMSAHVKAQGAKQMVTTGVEGFFSTKELNPAPWATGMGQDFYMNHNVPNIDFAVYHLWPDNWIRAKSLEEKVTFVKAWVKSHMNAAKKLGKPLVLEEFGKDLSQEFSTFATSWQQTP
eukprot:jgi/Mesvir1/7838/Mv25064-RA.5